MESFLVCPICEDFFHTAMVFPKVGSTTGLFFGLWHSSISGLPCCSSVQPRLLQRLHQALFAVRERVSLLQDGRIRFPVLFHYARTIHLRVDLQAVEVSELRNERVLDELTNSWRRVRCVSTFTRLCCHAVFDSVHSPTSGTPFMSVSRPPLQLLTRPL